MATQKHSKEVLKIADTINKIIEGNKNASIQNENPWKDAYNGVIDELKGWINSAKDQISEFSSECFTVNRVECEGHLRGLMYAKSILEERKRWIDEEQEG